jgi:predicted secreted protein
MAQQAALDWFWNEVEGATLARDADFFAQKLKQAKQIEKEQIKLAFNQGYRDAENDCCESVGTDVSECANAEQYYNENYAKQG